MGEVAVFALGVLIGLVLYWLVYRMFWYRWRANQERDLAYLRAKVESAQFTSLGLERQIAAQKADQAEQRAKMITLERENWQAQARLAAADKEKQAMVTHLDALRAELAAYKNAVSQPDLPALPLHENGNGKTHDPISAAHLLDQLSRAVPPNGKPNGKIDNKLETPKIEPVMASPLLIPSTNGKLHASAPVEQVLEPVLLIARPRLTGDRLEIIQGIGPVIVRKLNHAGIDSFQALSLLTPEKLKEIVGPRAAKFLDAEGVIDQARKVIGDRRARRAAG